MAVSYKCPQCAANLVFDADQQMMTCAYCGAKISPDDVSGTEAVISAEAMKQEAIEDERIRQEGAPPVVAPIVGEPGTTPSAEENVAGSGQSAVEIPGQFSEEDTLQYVCNSCGAAVLTDKSTAATFCAFCGSPTIIAERLVDARKPDYVIPFKYGRGKAVEAFFKWCKAGRFTPIEFVKDSNVEKLTGLYVPFWLFDCNTDMDVTAEGRTVSSSTSGSKTTTTTSYYQLIRKRKLRWDNIPFDGATRIDDKLMEYIEPYDYRAIEKFDMKYLSGFFADKYDQSPEALEGRLQGRLKKYYDAIFKGSVSHFSSISNIVDKSVHHKPETQYALLPVWMLNYKYLGKTYTFAMNGQTGKIAGEMPISIVKLIILGLVILPAAAVVCRVIGGAILGGFLG
jgi:DNA-directed RNA polymerase subunit RPC12/RpoP